MKLGKFHVSWAHDIERGFTTCFLQVEGTEKKVSGMAILSKKDTYSRRKGRKVSLTRALSKFDKPERTEAWMDYLERWPSKG